MAYKEDDLIVGIDIGSNKIVVSISEMDENGNITILGFGKAETKNGIKGGIVVNIDSVVNAINSAVEDAEIQAGREINGAFVGISGGNIETHNSKGVVAISGPDKEISESDISRVVEAAKAVAIPMDREILHIIPQNFFVDGARNIKYPIGMVGTRLECQVHLLTTPISSIQNVVKCLDRCNIEIYDIILQNIAASRAVLEEDEKELGVLMIDMGGETSKVGIYQHGAPYFNTIYPLGGYLITNDLAAGLKLSIADAEKIKIAHGVTHHEYVESIEKIQIPSIGGRRSRLLARENLVHIIRPRVQEILGIIMQDIAQKGFLEMIQGGIVITGGTANLAGIAEICQDVFNVQTRIGMPKKLMSISDEINSVNNAVSNGLIRWGYERINRDVDLKDKRPMEEAGVFKAIKSFFKEFF